MAARTDPPIRPDGRCVTCQGPRLARLPKVITIRSKADLLKHLARDPFCRTGCARAYHGVSLTNLEPQKAHDRGRSISIGSRS